MTLWLKPKIIRAMFAICALAAICASPLRSTAAEVQDVELNTTLMKSTFMITSQTGKPSLGTVFIMVRPYLNQSGKARYVLITAAHVLDEIQGDNAVVYFRHRNAPGLWVPVPTLIPIRSGGHPLWTRNPVADVAVMYIRVPNAATMPDKMLATSLLADDAMLSKYDIHPGDQLYCLGYPFGQVSSAGGFPILRSGTIASFPLLPTSETKSFLFDFKVFKGNSGGPVYITQDDRLYGGAEHVGETIHFIVGLVSQEMMYNEQLVGQYSEELHEYQLGLAVVVHASLIKQTIEMLPSPDTLPE